MKIQILALSMCLLTYSAFAQEDSKEYKMWVAHHVTIKPGKDAEAIKRIQEHDKKFHDNKGGLLHIMNGENAGDYYWIYGPFMFTDEMPKLSAAHDKDNNEIYTMFIEKKHNTKFWKENKALSYTHNEEDEYAQLELVYFKLEKNKYFEFMDLVKKHLEVYKEHKLGSIYTYNSRFGNKDGYNIMAEFPFKKWSDLDKDVDFKTKFEAIHGEGSLQRTGQKFSECIESAYTEVVVIVPAAK